MQEPFMLRDIDARKIAGNPSRTTWWRWDREGLIPPAIKVGRCNFRSLPELKEALQNLGCNTRFCNE